MREVLGVPPSALRTLLLGFAAKVPTGAMGLVLVLHGLDLGLGYTISGLVAATYALGMAAGAPIVGRVIDRRGQPVPLLVFTLVCAAAMILAAGLPEGVRPATMIGVAAVIGLTQPPLAVCARAIWTATLDTTHLRRILSLDASLQEVTFILGPLTIVSWATIRGSGEALVVAAVAGAVLTLVFAATAESRRAPRRGPEHRAAGVERFSARVHQLIAINFIVGAAIGVLEVAVIRHADHLGAADLVGLFYGLWALGSLVGGLLNLRRTFVGDLRRRMAWLLAALAVTHAVVAVATSSLGLAVTLFLAGLPAAPMFAAYYELVGEAAPDGRVTEVFAWGSTGGMAGVAAGTALGGALAGVITSRESILVCAAMLAAACVVAQVSDRWISAREERGGRGAGDHAPVVVDLED